MRRPYEKGSVTGERMHTVPPAGRLLEPGVRSG